jgi:hypothetical protein
LVAGEHTAGLVAGVHTKLAVVEHEVGCWGAYEVGCCGAHMKLVAEVHTGWLLRSIRIGC